MRVKSAFVAVALAAAAYAHWRTGAPDEAAARAMADAAAADAPAIADVVAPRRARVLPVVAAAGAQAGERTGALGDGTGAPYAGIYASPLFGALVAARTREPTVDESGLRYYAALHDRVRVAAEAKRLEELYPDWSPPTDLSARGGAGRDEQPLWDLFAAGKLDALRAAIRLRESTVAGWKPSSELAKKLGRREAQVAIAAATAKRDPRAALTAAAATPGALACDSVDTAWKVADAFVALDMPERAFELDQGVVATCKDFHERLATVERAVASLPEADARRLIALGAARADGTNEFAPAAIALTRALLVKESQGQKADVTAEEVAAYEAAAAASLNPDDLAILGWRRARAGDWTGADAWFARGMKVSARATFQVGHALALKSTGRRDEALAFARDRAGASRGMRAIYLSLYEDHLVRAGAAGEEPKGFRRFAAMVEAARSAKGAQAAAWHWFGRKAWTNARAWFEASLDWSHCDAAAGPSASCAGAEAAKTAEGYALTLRATRDLARAEDVSYAWRAASPGMAALYVDVVAAELGDPGVGPLPTPRIARFAEVVGSIKSPVGAQALGWLRLRAKSFDEAATWFADARGWGGAQEDGGLKIDEGYALALSGAGHYAKAEDVAWKWRDKSKPLADAYFGAMVVEISDVKRRDRTPEWRVRRFAGIVAAQKRADGAQALGWLRLHQQGCGYAIGWFRDAVAWSPGGVGDAKTREGLAQAYRASMRWHDAEDEAFALSGAVPAMRKLYEDVAIEELTRPWPSIPMSERRVGRFAALVMADKSARGAQALGWRRHDEPRSGYGVAWFARAIAWAKDAKPDVKTAEGYALALRHAGRFKDAEEVAFPFVAAVPAMRKLYVEDVVEQLTRDTPPEPMEEARIARFKSVFEPDKSPLAAQALAWYRHGRHEDAAARRWFKTALDWWPPVDLAKFKALPPQDAYVPILAKLALVPSDYRPTPLAYAPPPELTGKPDAAYAESPEGYAKTWEGYALALQATGDAAQAAKIAWEWRDRWPALRRLFVEVAMAELSGPDAAKLDATQVERFGAAIDLDKSSSGAAALGWFQLRSKSFDAASRWFDKALAWAKSSDELAATPEIQQGYVLALRGAGRDAEALAAAAKWRNANPAVNGLYVDAALAAVAKGGAKPGGVDMKNLDMADVESAVGERKSPDAALALGWSLYSAKDFAGATKWFGAALAWSPADKPSPKALEGQVRALAASGRAADAAIAAVKAAASAPDLRKVAVDSALGRLDAAYAGGADAPTPVLADVGKALSALKSSRGAADFAWKRVMRRDWPAAAAWFGAAVAWSPTAKDDPKVAEGRSIALRAIGRFDEADSALMPFIGKSDAMRDLFIGGVAARLTRKPPSPPPAAEMRTFAKLALDSRSALGAEALGWYAFNVRQYVPARDWFAKALEWRPSEGAARGLLMSYRGLGDHFGYGSALATWGAAFPDLMRAAPPASPTPAAYVPGDATGTPAATMRRPTLRRPFARTEAPSGAAAGRLAEGWRLLKLDRPQEAARAFEDALARGKGRTASDAAYGRSLALLRNGETSAAVAAASAAPLSRARRDEIGVEILTQRARAAFRAGDWSGALAALDRRDAFAQPQRDLMMLRGWSLFRLGRYDRALATFRAADAQLSDADSQGAVAAALQKTSNPRMSP